MPMSDVIIDYSFYTVVPPTLVVMLRDLGLCKYMLKWL